MSAARDSILATIRQALGAPEHDAGAIAAEAAALVADPGAYQPAFGAQGPRERFVAKATSERVTATLAEVGTLAAAPVAVAAYLAEAGLAPRIALQPTPRLTGLDWSGTAIHHAPAPDEPVAVSIADWAIAETGSAVFLSGPETPVLLSFLPLHHVVIVEAARILPYIEDLWAAMRGAGIAQPRNVNIVTGTSGTADIEAKNIRGAHGPRHMRIVLVG